MVRRLLKARSIEQAVDNMFYAVKSGRQCGIYRTWEECKKKVIGYSGAKFKKFKTKNEALAFMRGESIIGKSIGKVKSSYLHTGHSSHSLAIHLSSANAPVVYTDGGCFANGRRKAHAGIGVFWGEGDKRNVSERLEGSQTNQRAELNAAIKALERAVEDDIQEIEIRTDSMYTINCATTWISTWKRNGWMAASGEAVKNQLDIRKLDDLCQRVKVKWVHVKGHQGDFGNEQADRLSKIGASRISCN